MHTKRTTRLLSERAPWFQSSSISWGEKPCCCGGALPRTLQVCFFPLAESSGARWEWPASPSICSNRCSCHPRRARWIAAAEGRSDGSRAQHLWQMLCSWGAVCVGNCKHKTSSCQLGSALFRTIPRPTGFFIGWNRARRFCRTQHHNNMTLWQVWVQDPPWGPG